MESLIMDPPVPAPERILLRGLGMSAGVERETRANVDRSPTARATFPSRSDGKFGNGMAVSARFSTLKVTAAVHAAS
jgi:hypothetical protein